VATRSLVILLTIAVSIYLLEKLGNVAAALGNVIVLLSLAWLFAFTLQPVVHWLHHGIVPHPVVAWARHQSGDRLADRLAGLHLPYKLAVLVVLLLLLAVLLFAVLTLVPVVIDQIGQLSHSVEQLATSLPASFQRVIEWLNNLRETFIRDFKIDPGQFGLPSPDQLIGQLGAAVAGVSQFILQLATGVLSFFGQVLLVLLISAYMMIDGRGITAQVLRLLPDRIAHDVSLSIKTIDRTFGAFIRGTLLQAFIYGVAVSVLMVTFGLQFAVVVGVSTGILMIIPFLGGLIGLVLPLLAGLLQSSPNTGWLVLLLFAFQLILFNLIMPRILSQSLRMPTLLVFIALIVSGQLLGVWGLLFGVPLAGAAYSIGSVLLNRTRQSANTPADPDLLYG
jgi:predicted PurR-regulated permease PerM